MWVWSLGLEDPLENRMATQSGILAWKIPWIEEPGELQSMGLQSQKQLSTITVIIWGTFQITTIRALNHSLLISYSSPPIQWTSAGMCKAWRWIQTHSYLRVIYRGQAFPWISTQSVQYVLTLPNTSSYTGNFFNNQRLNVAKLGLIFQVWTH